MLHLNGYLGNLDTWLLLIAAWLSLGALMGLALGLIARVGQWEESQSGK